MKDITSVNTESIVFIVGNDTTRRMLMMYLAAMDLDARTYSSHEDYLAQHDFSRIQHLVLDMPLPGMDGAILQRQNIDEERAEENTGTFRLIPIQNKRHRGPLLTRFASRGAILDGTDITFSGFEE
jgi:hypothetical protein